MDSVKTYLFLLLGIFLAGSCSEQIDEEEEKKDDEVSTWIDSSRVLMSEFQLILDSAQVSGSLLFHDRLDDRYYSNNFSWKLDGTLPASTFKIANSIIGLETGVIEHDRVVFLWDGQPRRMDIWEQDLPFKKAFHYSCVPCYQKVAHEIGAERMNSYLTKLDYGDMKVDSSSISNFWLEGDSKITQLQQLDFLERFYSGKLPISKKTEEIMKEMMVIQETKDYKISGKSGWSIRNGNNNGWFVGYIETAEDTYFFATNIEPKETLDMKSFPALRKDVTMEALKKLNIL